MRTCRFAKANKIVLKCRGLNANGRFKKNVYCRSECYKYGYLHRPVKTSQRSGLDWPHVFRFDVVCIAHICPELFCVYYIGQFSWCVPECVISRLRRQCSPQSSCVQSVTAKTFSGVSNKSKNFQVVTVQV